MKRRELLVALGVLVPFALLVLAGLWWTAPQPSGAPLPVLDPSAPQPSARLQHVEAVGAPVVADAGLDLTPDAGVALHPALQAVRPEVELCLKDQGERVPANAHLDVDFTPTRDGGYEHVHIHLSWQNPWLEACLEDVFDQVGWVPGPDSPLTPVHHSFR